MPMVLAELANERCLLERASSSRRLACGPEGVPGRFMCIRKGQRESLDVENTPVVGNRHLETTETTICLIDSLAANNSGQRGERRQQLEELIAGGANIEMKLFKPSCSRVDQKADTNLLAIWSTDSIHDDDGDPEAATIFMTQQVYLFVLCPRHRRNYLS